MKTPRKQIARIIATDTLNGDFNQEQVTSLAAYLLSERRTGELESLMRDVQYTWAKQGIVEVVAYSAHDLSADAMHAIEAEARRIYPEATRVVITPQRDLSVIGGVRLELADHRLDLSVAGELRKFKTLAVQGKD